MEPINPRTSAFSLVELLVVMAILAILLTLTVPAVSSVLESINISRGAQLLESQLQLARQLASSRSRPIEIRLIKSGNPSNGGISAIQLWQVDPPTDANSNSAHPVNRVEYFPNGICISEDPTKCSPLLSACPLTNVIPANSALNGSSYAAFQIHPAGLVSPALAMNRLYVTVLPARNGSAQQLPRNFATIQINPVTGTPRIYQP